MLLHARVKQLAQRAPVSSRTHAACCARCGGIKTLRAKLDTIANPFGSISQMYFQYGSQKPEHVLARCSCHCLNTVSAGPLRNLKAMVGRVEGFLCDGDGGCNTVLLKVLLPTCDSLWRETSEVVAQPLPMISYNFTNVEFGAGIYLLFPIFC